MINYQLIRENNYLSFEVEQNNPNYLLQRNIYCLNQQKITYYYGPFQANKIYTIVEHLGIVGIKGDTNDDQFVDVLDVVRTINEILNDNFLTDKELWLSLIHI